MRVKTEETYYELLQALGAGGIQHYGRTLLEHLEGTYKLLRQWRNPEEICVAGLFHSVYGTERLDSSKLESIDRSELEEMIGHNSERLVFLFSMANRTSLLTQNILPPFQIVRRDTSEAITVAPETLSALLEIGAANLVEQMPYFPTGAFVTVREEVGLFQGMQEYLSADAGRALFISLKEFKER
ncbi:MAG: hypothetical protein QNI91_13525 [Arenicellales bacterium]|nr:hypothetical protein [Arenicellales bacterium]